jgi:hypothetical protein
MEIMTNINNKDIPDLQLIGFLFPLITDNAMSWLTWPLQYFMRGRRLSPRFVVKSVRTRDINGEMTITCGDYSMGQE